MSVRRAALAILAVSLLAGCVSQRAIPPAAQAEAIAAAEQDAQTIALAGESGNLIWPLRSTHRHTPETAGVYDEGGAAPGIG